MAANVFNSTSDPTDVERLFSAELSGTLPGIAGADPLTGHFLLRSTTINSFSRSTNNSVATVSGTANLLRLDRTVDPLTGAYTNTGSGIAVGPALSFRLRLRDYDLASPEPLNGIYAGPVESRNAAGANGTLFDGAELVVYQPGGTNILFSTDGFDPIKSSNSSPFTTTDPLHPYQPNIWL